MVLARGHHPPTRTAALIRIFPNSPSCNGTTYTHTHFHSSSRTRFHFQRPEADLRPPSNSPATPVYNQTLLSPSCTLIHLLPESIPHINMCTVQYILSVIHVAFPHSNEHSRGDLLLNSLAHTNQTSINKSSLYFAMNSKAWT